MLEPQAVRILVVDDFEPWRRWVCLLLSGQENLKVIAEVPDGLEAVQKVELLRPDLILLDIGLPNVNGLEVASRISKSARGVRTIFVTNEIHADVVNAALSSGALGYIAKADAVTDLLPAIEAALRDESFLSKRIKEVDLGEKDWGEKDWGEKDCDEGCLVGPPSSNAG